MNETPRYYPLHKSREEQKNMYTSLPGKKKNLISQRTKIEFKVSRETVKMFYDDEHANTERFKVSGLKSWSEANDPQMKSKPKKQNKKEHKDKGLDYYTEKILKNILKHEKEHSGHSGR